MEQRVPAPTRRSTAAGFAVVVLLAIASVAGFLTLQHLRNVAASGGAAAGVAQAPGTDGSRPGLPGASAGSDRASAADRVDPLAGMLESRSAAVLRRDATGWLA